MITAERTAADTGKMKYQQLKESFTICEAGIAIPTNPMGYDVSRSIEVPALRYPNPFWLKLNVAVWAAKMQTPAIIFIRQIQSCFR